MGGKLPVACVSLVSHATDDGECVLALFRKAHFKVQTISSLRGIATGTKGFAGDIHLDARSEPPSLKNCSLKSIFTA